MNFVDETFALFAGSGFQTYLTDAEETLCETPYGCPSAPLRRIAMGGSQVFVMLRHGDDFSIPPHKINYRANLHALQAAGVTSVIALNTVGTVARPGEEPAPGSVVIPHRLLDYTWGREHTFSDGSADSVRHIDFTGPFDAGLRQRLLQAAAAGNCAVRDGGTYAATQGPRLETAAEVDKLERDGADLIGMTAAPEAPLARELGMAYACVSLVVNHGAGRGTRADTDVHDGIAEYTARARAIANELLQAFFESSGA